MLKKIGLMAIVALMSVGGIRAVEVGDVAEEYTEEIFSETDRITVDDVEYLYTFKGIRPCKSIVTETNPYWTSYYTKYGTIETQFVIEKAIPLTGNYDIVINLENLLGAFGHTDNHKKLGYECGFEINSGDSDYTYVWTNFYYTGASSIVIGDSCFEDNELIKTVNIMPDETQRNLRIGKRAFYGAVNLKFIETSKLIFDGGSWEGDMKNRFKNLQLLSIGESAFVGCINLKVIGCACEELERIDDYAFNECAMFIGFLDTFEQLQYVFYSDADEYFNLSYKINWDTPKLAYIGKYAFNNAGIDISETYYDANYGYQRSGLKWTFLNGDILIGESAFASCGFLKEIHFPLNMERINENSFRGLSKGYYNITQLNFPESLISVGNYAFYDSNIQVMRWPESLREIGDYAFSVSVPVDYQINSNKTAVISKLMYKWPELPMTIEKLGEGAFSGMCEYGADSNPLWVNGEIVRLYRSDTAVGKCGAISETVVYPSNLTSVPYCCFSGNALLENVILHESVTSIGSYAFQGCGSLNLVVPMSVCEVGVKAGASLIDWTGSVPGPKSVIFEGKPPKGMVQSGFLECPQLMVSVEYASDWAPYFRPNMKFAKKVDGEWVALGGKVISNAMRSSDPTIMDIKYKVTSTKDKVNVRILAFEDGNRSFAKVLRPETFVDGTETNVGDGVAANVEHTISWQVSKDWDVDLAKVSIEVYVQEDNLLPLQLTTIPAMGERAAVTFSRNVPDRDKVMNALYWLYADKAADLTLANGVLKCGNTQLVNGSTLSDANAVSYIYSKMGYGTLSGDTLKYVNELMRTNLNPSGITQYAVKEGAAQ